MSAANASLQGNSMRYKISRVPRLPSFLQGEALKEPVRPSNLWRAIGGQVVRHHDFGIVRKALIANLIDQLLNGGILDAAPLLPDLTAKLLPEVAGS